MSVTVNYTGFFYPFLLILHWGKLDLQAALVHQPVSWTSCKVRSIASYLEGSLVRGSLQSDSETSSSAGAPHN